MTWISVIQELRFNRSGSLLSGATLCHPRQGRPTFCHHQLPDAPPPDDEPPPQDESLPELKELLELPESNELNELPELIAL
jgi:hypothetical protein